MWDCWCQICWYMKPVCGKGIGKLIAIGICAALYVVVSDVTVWWYMCDGAWLVHCVCVCTVLRHDTNSVFRSMCY